MAFLPLFCVFLSGDFLQSLYWCGLRACSPVVFQPEKGRFFVMNTVGGRATSGFACFVHQKSAFFCKNAHFCAQAKNAPQPLRCLVCGRVLCILVVSWFHMLKSACKPRGVCVFVVLYAEISLFWLP
ncbi:hypothetical protein GSO32_000043 [Salmonella enterica]|nr:hypothetical protein [Salmonella enterica]EEJ8357079.1 hypothetical protein [Salmonella enterica]